MRAKFIFENPNAIIPPDVWEKKKDQSSYTPKPIEYDSEGVIPFGFYGSSNTLIIGTKNQAHMDLLKKAYKKGIIASRNELEERGDNTGRLFTKQKVITFWNFPKDYNELVNVLKELEKETKLNILNDPEWKVEIPAGEFKEEIDKKGSWGSWKPRIGQIKYIPIDQYKGGYKRSEAELGQEHIKSPLHKKKRTPWINTKKPTGLDRLKMRLAMQSESFYPRLKFK